MNSRIHVAVGVIYNKQKDKVLISKRTDDQHLAGFWEFPGGKIKPDENVKFALKRELNEELGIDVHEAEHLTTIRHDYPDKKVLLDVWSIYDWSGEVVGREKQDIIWTPLGDLKNYSFPEANKYIIKSVLLPYVYVISQDNYEDISYLIDTVNACFEAGLKIFQLRLAQKDDCKFEKIVSDVKQLSDKFGSKLILNGTPDDIENYDIDGIHLKSNELLKYSERPIDCKYLLGASCHSDSELKHAVSVDVDYVLISPVNKTSSHPKQHALGWSVFEKLCRLTNIPTYALGGMTPIDLKRVKSCGGQGIAMLSALWDSKFPCDVIRSSEY